MHKSNKYLITIFLTIILIFTFSSCKEKPHTDFEYTEEDKKITITGYTGESKDVVIPKKINRRLVTTIGKSAFGFKQLTSVIIPNSVTIIGDSAFAGNELTDIIIPNSVSVIENYAFTSNKITEIRIPNSVTAIWDNAFTQNPLTKITLLGNIKIQLSSFYVSVYMDYVENKKKAKTYNISLSENDDYIYAIINDLFIEIIRYKNIEKNIIIPEVIDGISVSAIGHNAFFGHQLTEIFIPDSIIAIGDWALAGNNLTTVTLPSSVISIGAHSFRENQIKSLTIPNSVTTIMEHAFTHNQLTEITIPDSVNMIWDYAFNFNQITSVTIPNSVKTLGFMVFDHDVEVVRE